jgi:UDP-3-O-[3-hydroxymyristoyl] glucosamine N-acyltransferase
LTVGDGARIAAKTGVTKDVPPGADVSGYPAGPHRDQLRREAAGRRIEEGLERLKAVEERLTRLEAKGKP